MAKRPKKEEKKRVENQPIFKQESRKRPDPEPEPPTSKPIKVNQDYKFVRLAMDAPQEQFKAVGDRVQSGELKWDHYAIDGNKCYHHYLILNKEQNDIKGKN